MATSNNDRISSRRLLDTLKGLQASRHLGSEPEVETVSVEYPAVVSPAEGTYNDMTSFREEMASKAVDENRLPVKIYTTPSNPNTNPVFPLTINEPSGAYVEADKKIKWHNFDGYANEEVADENTYTGYMVLNMAGMWAGYHIENGTPDNNQYQWEMPAYTETTTTKTKHTIKQDYLPNADWNVNDPDADGYVQGRTHWVEEKRTTYDSSVTSVNDAINGYIDPVAVGKIVKMTYNGGEFVPTNDGFYLETDEGGMSVKYAYNGLDENGSPIVVNSFAELQSAITITRIGVLIAEQSDNDSTMLQGIVWYPNVAVDDTVSITVKTEQVHKLDKKYYDYVDIKQLKKSLQVEYPFGWYLGAGDIELSSYFNNYSQGMYSGNGLLVTYLYSGDAIVALKVATTQYSPKTAIYYFGSKVAVPIQKIYRKLHNVTARAKTLGVSVNYMYNFIPFVFYMKKTNFQCCKFDNIEMYNESDKVCTKYKGDTASSILNNVCIEFDGFQNFNTNEDVEIVLLPYRWKNYYFVNWNKNSQYSQREDMSNPFIIAANENRFVVDETSQKIYWRVEWDSLDFVNATISVNNTYKNVPRGTNLFRLQPPTDFIDKEVECYAIDNNGNKHVATIKIGRYNDKIKSDDTFTCVKIYANIAIDIYKPVWQYIDELNSKSYRDHEYVSLDELL